MGIPSYFNYILRNHTNIISKKRQVSSDYLFVDANSLIYDTINNYKECIPDEFESIYIDVYNNITKLISTVSPKKKSYICFDGVPPVAKIMQQKQRRFKSTLTSEILSTGSTNSFNRNQITPGTLFMKGLDRYLIDAFESYDDIVFSGSSIPMEGEQKICKIISSHQSLKDKNLIIYGLDADLFMLGLLMVFKGNNIFLFKETKYFRYIKGINDDELYYFNINTFSSQLTKELQVNEKQSICDYCLLAFLCGNDFLPHLHCVNIRNEGISYIIEKYLELNKFQNKPLINIINGKINWKHFRHFITLLVKDEKDKILENLSWKISQKKKIRPLSEADKLDLLPCVDNEKEIYVYNNIEEFNNLIFPNINPKDVSKNYIEMIEWTWYYYFNNGVLDNTKFYNYANAPLLSDCLKFIPLFNDDCVVRDKTTVEISNTTLLLYVLPFQEHRRVLSCDEYKRVSAVVYNQIPLIKETNYKIDYFLRKFFWEGHLNIANIDIFHLNNIIVENI